MSRSPFFNVDGKWYVDLTWNWDDSRVMPTAEEWVKLVAATPPQELVVGRALTAAELGRFKSTRDDVDAESFAFIIPTDEARWRSPKERRRARRR